MVESQPDERAMAAAHVQAAQLQARLSRLCQRIAEVEDELARTLCEVATTASPDRAQRLHAHAAEARAFAEKERSLAAQLAE
ncbi:MAG TPA: hypothetical protein VFH66_02190 [Mycobacteriales bacterium]|nr:hypothetical protein [Mycobacteriales bacterium]